MFSQFRQRTTKQLTNRGRRSSTKMGDLLARPFRHVVEVHQIGFGVGKQHGQRGKNLGVINLVIPEGFNARGLEYGNLFFQADVREVPAALEKLARLVANNLAKPRGQQAMSLKGIFTAQGVQQALLNNVFSIFAVTNDSERDPIKPCQDVLEGVMVVRQMLQGLRKIAMHSCSSSKSLRPPLALYLIRPLS
jgi:hypothetical protein